MLRGAWVAKVVKHLPSAQVVIPVGSSPVGLPAGLGACFSLSLYLFPQLVLTLSVSQIKALSLLKKLMLNFVKYFPCIY